MYIPFFCARKEPVECDHSVVNRESGSGKCALCDCPAFVNPRGLVAGVLAALLPIALALPVARTHPTSSGSSV